MGEEKGESNEAIDCSVSVSVCVALLPKEADRLCVRSDALLVELWEGGGCVRGFLTVLLPWEGRAANCMCDNMWRMEWSSSLACLERCSFTSVACRKSSIPGRFFLIRVRKSIASSDFISEFVILL